MLLQQSSGGLLQSLPFLLAMLGVMFVFMYLPNMRKQKKEKQFKESLKKGSRVITTSGIHGKIVDIVTSDNTVLIETNAGKLKFEMAAISSELSRKYN